MSDGNVKVITAPYQTKSNSPVPPETEPVPASHTSPSAATGFSTPPTRSQPRPPTTPKPAKSRVIQQILYLASMKENTKVQSKLSMLQQININA
jgi:hypothetical protein